MTTMTSSAVVAPRAARPNTLTAPAKADLFGVGVSLAGPEEVRRCIVEWAAARRSSAADFMAVHSLVTAVRDPAYREAVRDFDLVACDGQPVRWALNRFYQAGIEERCYGPHMMMHICEDAAERGIGVYLYGGKDDVLDKLQAALAERLPALRVAGAESPPFRALTEDEHDETAARINASGAGVVLIGIGCPKQELFAARHLADINAVMMCVGAAFDFHAGHVQMAPAWMQQRGLEWVYRLVKEPRRLWKRYFVTNTIFLALVVRRSVRGR